MSEAIVKKCVNTACKSEYQDKEYGKGNRVYNLTIKGSRCSVCGTTTNEGGKK